MDFDALDLPPTNTLPVGVEGGFASRPIGPDAARAHSGWDAGRQLIAARCIVEYAHRAAVGTYVWLQWAAKVLVG
jgi:hypothetical protein